MTLEVVLPYLAGLVGVPVVNFVKSSLGWSGKAAVYVAMAVSVALAAGSLAITGGFTGEDLLANLFIVFSVATAAYKLLPSQLASLGE